VLAGKRALTSDFIHRLATYFKVSPAAFFPDNPPEASRRLSLREMRALVREELAHIPRRRGDIPQNTLRMAYNALRLHQLKKDPSEAARTSLEAAIDQVRVSFPDYQPAYDHDFFD
jgi:hypothetical protein